MLRGAHKPHAPLPPPPPLKGARTVGGATNEDDLSEVGYPMQSVGVEVVGLFIYPVLLSTHSLNDGNLESKTVEGAAADEH